MKAYKHNHKTYLCLRICFPFFFFLWGSVSQGQTYDTLYQKILEFKGRPESQVPYLRQFIEKAKREGNTEELVNGYRNYMHHAEGSDALTYADSMVLAALITRDPLLIGGAYLSKGILFYGQKEYGPALEHYLIANDYIQGTDNLYLRYKVHYNIAQIKYYLGEYSDAISLLEGCATYYKAGHSRPYLNSLHSLALCYNRKGDIDLSSEMVQRGLEEGKRLMIDQMEAYFMQIDGINHYFVGNYGTAISRLNSSLPEIRANQDFANEAVDYFYIGKCYWSLKYRDKALLYFRKVDELFAREDYMRDDLRECYMLMAEYYKSQRDYEAQLYSLNQLLRADSVLKYHYKHLSRKIHAYDRQSILQEKEIAVDQLKKERNAQRGLIGAVALLSLALIVFIYRHFKNRRLYKKRFEELMRRRSRPERNSVVKKELPTINSEALKTVLKQLENFERDKKFLDKDWTLVKLAAHFNSNTKYLSLIIHQYRSKNFPEYINELKIEFLIELLKKNRMIRKYTNKALAEECGFSSTERFVNAFKSYTGISPGYFIKELEKQEDI